MNYKLLVFDWDGTLADSLQGIIYTMEQAISHMQLEQRDHDSIRAIIGLGLNEAIEQLYPELPGSEREKLREYYGQYYRTPGNAPIKLFTGVEQVLSHLHGQDYLLAIATGKSRRGLERAFRETNMGSFFHASRCADETFSKPHPQMLEEIMTLFDVSPEQTIMVGDSEHDMQMANNAGVTPIAVNYGAQREEHLLKFNPLLCLNHLNELADWLELSGPKPVFENHE